MNKVHAIIPARGGSVGIPRKNIALVGEHPLLAYSIKACQLCRHIDRVIVSTEDEEIADVARFYGAEVPFMRPQEHSANNSRDVGFLSHFFDNIDTEQVALIRPTTPLRDPEKMSEAIVAFFEHKDEITSLRTLNAVNQSPYKLFQLENNICKGMFPDFNGIKNYSNLPRQMFPRCYEGNGLIDLVKKETVAKGDAFGDKIYGFVIDKLVDIDSKFDLEILKLQINTEKDLLTKHLEML